MTKLVEKDFRSLPPPICNYYDKGPSARRVLAAHARDLKTAGREYVVVHTYGRDYWRYETGEWRLYRSSDPETAGRLKRHEPLGEDWQDAPPAAPRRKMFGGSEGNREE